MGIVRVWRLTCRNKPDAVELIFKPAPRSLDEAAGHLPPCAYTTLRTYQGNRVLHLEWQVRRLEQTARLANLPLQVDMDCLRTAMRQVVADYNAVDVRMRIYLDLSQEPGVVYLAVERLRQPPRRLYLDGAAAITRVMHRDEPQAKRSEFLSLAAEVRRGITGPVHEVLMVSTEGRLLEGLSSNFFGVRSGELWTAGDGILPGFTRELVLDEAKRLGIVVHFEAVHLAEVGILEEAFITSATRGVLPIVRIDDHIIGNGKPGPITRRLRSAYERRVIQEAELL